MSVDPDDRGRDLVAVILAVGIATAVNSITFAVLYDAIFSEGPGLSENAVQVMTLAFGGIIGVLGGYVGGRAVERQRRADGTPPAAAAEPGAVQSPEPGDT